MKKIVLGILSILLISNTVLAENLQAKSPAANSAVEIDQIFIDSQNYKKTKKPKAEKKPKKEKVTKESKAKPVQEQKETVTTTSDKELKQKLKQEEERKLHRELQELTQLNQQAIALYTDNNLDESLKTFAKIPEDKRTPEIWLLMGNILMDKGKNDEAVFMYGRAILVDPTFYKAHYNLGNIYLSEDKFNMAIDQYKLAVRYNPNSAYAYYNLGCAYIKAGDLKKAKYSFIRAVELKNNAAEFHYNLAYVFKKLNKEKQAKIYLDNYNKLTGELN